jgi:EmrB/QacA subfamily drug resistance transporter
LTATTNARAGAPGIPLLPATAVVLCGALMSRIQDTALSIANPALMADFGVPAATIAWISLAPMLMSASLLTIFGRLADLRGRRNLYAIGIVIFGIGSAFCALSPSFAVLIVARIVQGLGGALMAANSVAYLIDIYSPARRGFVVGLWEAGIATGSGIGPVIGGAVIEAAGWQGSFAMIVPMAIAMLVAVPFTMKEPSRAPAIPKFDFAGAVSFGVGVAAFLFALTQASVAGWGSPVVLGSLALATVCGVLFVRVENQIDSPMIDLRMFRSRTFTAGNLAKVAGYLPFAAHGFLLPFYLKEVLALPPTGIGSILVALPAGMFAASLISGPLSDRIGTRVLAPAGLALQAVGCVVLAIANADQGVWAPVVGTLLGGVGIGAFIAPNDSAILAASPRDRIGVANGILGVSRTAGMLLGVALGGAGLSARVATHGGSFLDGFHDVYWFVSVIAFAGVAVATIRDSPTMEPRA